MSFRNSVNTARLSHFLDYVGLLGVAIKLFAVSASIGSLLGHVCVTKIRDYLQIGPRVNIIFYRTLVFVHGLQRA